MGLNLRRPVSRLWLIPVALASPPSILGVPWLFSARSFALVRPFARQLLDLYWLPPELLFRVRAELTAGFLLRAYFLYVGVGLVIVAAIRLKRSTWRA